MPNNPPKNNTPDKSLVEEAQFSIQERDDDMLIAERDWQFGWRCIARRPKMMSNEDWRPVAERIVAALSQPQHGGLVEAVEQAIAWHEEHDEAISKQENALDPHNVWRRLHHQEQRDMLRVALSNSPVVGEEAIARLHAVAAKMGPCEASADLLSVISSIEDSRPTPTDTADRREAVAKIDVKAIWRKHGGSQHGPNVEQYYIEERAFYRFAADYRDAILSLIAGPPEGFVTVPVEPTEAMLAAMLVAEDDGDKRDEWAAALAARPGEPA